MEKKEYECSKCNQKVRASHAPECCGEPMKLCLLTSTAEHDRPMDDAEPCDDSRYG